MSRHRDQLNTNKQGRNRIFYVATKIPTQGREVLSRHNKLGRDSKHRQYQEAKMKLQQEIRLSGEKTMS